MRQRIIAVLLAASLAGPVPAMAWDRDGHWVVGYIAQRMLTPAAQVQARDLLGGRGLEDVASWADDAAQKATAAQRARHFIDVPIDAESFSVAPHCPNQDCVVRAIERNAEAIAATSGLAHDARRDALRFLVHFVGDLHQPLHVGDNHDRGGNAVKLPHAGQGAELNLHKVWDGLVLAQAGPRADVARRLLAQARSMTAEQRATLMQGGAARWAERSWDISRGYVYPRLNGGPLPPPGWAGPADGGLPEGYVEGAVPLVEEQLLHAGIRLAAALNARLR